MSTTTNITGLLDGFLTPKLVSGLASAVGESTRSAERAMDGVVPSLLASLLKAVSTPSGADSVYDMAMAQSQHVAALGGALLDGGEAERDLLAAGAGIVQRLLGDKAGDAAGLIAGQAGVKLSAAASLLSLAAPLVLGFVGRQAASQNLDASGLASFLTGQREAILRLSPPGLDGILGFGSGTAPAPVAPWQRALPAQPVAPPDRRWTVPLLLAGVLVTGWLAYRAGTERSTAETVTLGLPNGSSVLLERGSLSHQLAGFLAQGSSSELPKRFVFDHLPFDSGSAQVPAESAPAIANLAAILAAYPDAGVRVEGHTDDTGDPASNSTLSLERANAVKAMLTRAGISAGRVETAGHGSAVPLASNDTEAGRTQNRRTELVVTGMSAGGHPTAP